MSYAEAKITVHVKYGDLEETFSGNVEDVWKAINRFFSDFIPTFELSKMLVLNVDLQELVGEFRGIIGFADKMPHLLVPKEKLTDNETLALYLLAAYLGHRLGMLNSDVMTREELQVKLGKNPKITSTRLGELVKGEIVEKTGEGGYRITTFGIIQLKREWLPRIRAKLGL
ncbi:MAG: hypothetical protein N3F10_01865 [Candidatus Bathyarchaeota archaeon]|nr:hypothetical protein [Candidatus Bathyarchaeota archaeon]MCX8177030.1 hypothetical protein [Candidatus Bathyarchaeota archaeon]MDW8194231.1 hypothetical protein [Nitrososphaerota archaeon]